MKITVLDGFALNPGDNPFDELTELGEVTVYDRTEPGEVIPRSRGAEILLTNKTVIGEEEMAALPELKMIGVLATGYNTVDTEAAAKRGIPVCNVPAYGTESVAQLAFALILELCHNVRRHSDSVMAGEWERAADYSYWNFPLIELAGKTLGIIGYGAIGARTAALGRAFGMKIVAHDPFPRPAPDREDFRFAPFEEVLAEADFLSLHCPLTDENRNMINAQTIALMKPGAYLINTSRGPLINEADLADALNAGRLAGAGLDVLSKEPPKGGNPLFSAKNAVITPHIAWATIEARRRLTKTAVENVRAFVQGRPQNVVNGVK